MFHRTSKHRAETATHGEMLLTLGTDQCSHESHHSSSAASAASAACAVLSEMNQTSCSLCWAVGDGGSSLVFILQCGAVVHE